jgi:hypothetical protein
MKRFFVLTVIFTLGPCAYSQTPPDKMVQSSVAVFGAVMENGKMKPVSRGGGFMIDSRHVVTNLTACCGKTSRGVQAQPVVVAGEKDASTAKVVWSNAEAEIAILELKDAFQRPALAVAPLQAVEKDQAVYTAQFPDPGESGRVPKLTQGKILSLVKIESSGVQVYKTSASMNKANSGGALFDACGSVIGINMMMKDGAQYAYVIDPLAAGLRSAGLEMKVEGHCGSSATSTGTPSTPPTESSPKKAEPVRAREWRLPEGSEWIPVGLLAAAILMAFRSPKKKAAEAMLRQQPLPEPQAYVPQIAPMPARPVGMTGSRPSIHGIAGQYAGKSFSLDAGPSVLGRDQRISNLVFAPEAHSISKRHCTVSWDGARRTFVVQDLGSTNGTFLATGERLTPGQPRDLPAGGRFFIGDLRNQFEVRME